MQFIPCDIFSLLLQLIGGVLGAVGLDEEELEPILQGTDILTAGLAWQVFSLLCFLVACADLFFRIRRRRRQLGDAAALSQDAHAVAVRSSPLFLGFQVAILLATLLIFWRCIYRLVELNDGFWGPVTFEQNLFVGFEGILIVIATSALAIMHPAFCLGEAVGKKG